MIARNVRQTLAQVHPLVASGGSLIGGIAAFVPQSLSLHVAPLPVKDTVDQSVAKTLRAWLGEPLVQNASWPGNSVLKKVWWTSFFSSIFMAL
jgi:hypothetical protein